jgi:hypothetical protein
VGDKCWWGGQRTAAPINPLFTIDDNNPHHQAVVGMSGQTVSTHSSIADTTMEVAN